MMYLTLFLVFLGISCAVVWCNRASKNTLSAGADYDAGQKLKKKK